jgi:hypothetical protein
VPKGFEKFLKRAKKGKSDDAEKQEDKEAK